MSLAKAIVAGCSLGVASLTLAPQIALAGVVVSSSGPSAGDYPVGTQIDDNERITLSAGDAVTVLDNGGTRVFRGAGTYMLSQQSGASRNRAFASLTTQRSASRARTGAVRTAGAGEVSNPILWYVNVEQAGTICIADPANIRLWRANTQAQSTYSIASDDGAVEVTFPAGEMLAAWDIYTPAQESVTYRIGYGAGSNAVEVNFVFLETVPATPEDMANALIANNCTVQLEQMSNAMMGG